MRVQIGYGQVDPSAKPDSNPQSADVMPWAKLDDLKFDDVKPINAATLEHNYGILDGRQMHFPNNTEPYSWGLWSSELSGSDGSFKTPPVLDISFSFPHRSPGITLLFYPHSDDWASRVNVTWFNLENAVIQSGTYTISGTAGDILQRVSGFARIKVEFLSTNIPYRYVKLIGIDYGKGRTFGDKNIDTVRMLEEIDPLSDRISVNTLNFRIRTNNPEFSLVSGVGDDMLMQLQQCNVVADGKEFGTFFLQFPWKDIYGDGTVIDFQAVDATGVMDNYTFYGGIYKDTPIITIINELFDICFPTKIITYVIEQEFQEEKISGWIPICSCREALQLICFSIGAVADTSRRDYVWIYKPDTEVHSTLDIETIYHSPSILPTDYYSGVDITAHEYIESEDITEVFNSTLPAGRHLIKFSEPVHSVTVNGAELINSGSNYADINLESVAPVIITAKKYIVNRPLYSIRGEAHQGEIEKVKIIDGCTLMTMDKAIIRAAEIYAYLQQRAQFDGDVRLNDNEPGYVVQVPTRGNPITGTIESLNIDLKSGKARMRVTGRVDNTNNR